MNEHPAVAQHRARRAADRQLRVADSITSFAGSMRFIYIHAVWFTVWIALGVEPFPFGLLTMIVSLEAIFLSTFVMIGQNRQSDMAAHKAAHDYEYQVKELRTNTALTKQVHELSVETHELVRKLAARRRKL